MACDCQVYVTCRGKMADARQVFDLMGLIVKRGDELVFRLDGAGEEGGARSLKQVVEEIL